MKTNYRHSVKTPATSKWAYAVVIFVAFFLLYPSLEGFLKTPKNFLIKVAQPLWRIQAEGEEGNSFFEYFASKKELLDVNRKLKEEVQEQESLRAINMLLSDENEQLKSLLGRPSLSLNRVLATILVRPGRVPFDTLLIDAGSAQGVVIGSHVSVRDNNVIGRVAEVFDTTSRVTLYSSPEEVSLVLIGPKNIGAEAHGLGGGNFEIILPREVPIEKGDVISVPGTEPFVLGVVGYIEREPSDAFQRILFKSTVSIQEIKFVEVLIR